MKFKNKDDSFEWEVLGLDEEEYVRKIKIFSPFEKKSQNIYNFDLAREKWNNSTSKKKFKKRINKAIQDLENEDYTYSSIVNLFIALSSIETHLFIELEYYESSKQTLKEFLNVVDIFLNTFNKINTQFKELILNPDKLNIYRGELLEILNFFKDY